MTLRPNVISHQPDLDHGPMTAVLAAALALAAVGGCTTATDVTYDPARGFAPLMNRCYVLRQEVIIERRGATEATDFMMYPADTGGEHLVDAFRAGAIEADDRVATLVPGTRLRVGRMIAFAGWTPHEEVTARILNGPLKDKSLEIDDVLKWELADKGGQGFLTRPKINDRYLVPTEKTDP
jgi:hypothetical protein